MASFGGDESVVVIGLGRFGGALALELISQDIEVLGIDSRPKVVQRFAENIGRVVIADSTDVEALRQLGVAEFRHAVVAIGGDMEANMLTTSLLVELEVPDIWVKAVSRQHADILTRLGAHHVVLPEFEMGERVAHLLTGRILDYIELDRDYAMIKTRPPRDMVGIPLRDTGLWTKYGVTLVSVKRQVDGPDAAFTPITPETVLMYGDLVLVVGKIKKVERFAED